MIFKIKLSTMKLKIKLQGLATQCDKDSYDLDAKQ